MKPAIERIELSTEELERLLEQARVEPLPEENYQKLKAAVDTLEYLTELVADKDTTIRHLRQLLLPASTEKTKEVLAKAGAAGANPSTESQPEDGQEQPRVEAQPGHGRNSADAFTGAQKVDVRHQDLKHGDRCPECEKGNVYGQKEPKVLVRIVGQAPLAATVYSLERLRCGACGQIFTAEEPEGVGSEKYDETASAMIAQLKYGSGTPLYRLERLERHLGIPLPAATQWEIGEEAAEVIKPARDELLRQAAQGEVLHNDDTGMRVLRLAREPSYQRTGVFTSGIVATMQGRQIALYFTGPKHAGENLADVLKRRAAELPPLIQMSDALSRNVPKLPAGVEMLLARCLAHGRRQFVEVAQNFPDQCRYVLETLGEVYGYDAEARERGLSPEERLRFHQEHSQPLMDKLHAWLEAQFAERRTEPNSGLGKAITYLLRHWKGLTLFLREAWAPLDNNLVERSLKRAVLHRKNALFYRTLNGAQVGDLFMSLIHANSFDYLTELQRHAQELAVNPPNGCPGTTARRSGGLEYDEPSWPKRIDSGHGRVRYLDAQKTGFSKRKIRTRFLARHRTSAMANFSRSLHVKSLLLVLCIGVLLLCRLTFAQNPSPGQEAAPPKADAQISFGALKTLAGTWTGRVTTDPPNPEIDGPIQATMRVASRGNVLVHEIAPGGMPEPTMIYVEGDRLTLVHYCEAGNRPRMVARKSPDQKTVAFDFIDISGSKGPAYLHHFVFTIINADHHTEDWTFMLPGDKLLHARFDLKRAKESDTLPARK